MAWALWVAGMHSMPKLYISPGLSERVHLALTRRLESFMAGASGSAMPAEMGTVEIPTVPGAPDATVAEQNEHQDRDAILLEVRTRRMTNVTDLGHQGDWMFRNPTRTTHWRSCQPVRHWQLEWHPWWQPWRQAVKSLRRWSGIHRRCRTIWSDLWTRWPRRSKAWAMLSNPWQGACRITQEGLELCVESFKRCASILNESRGCHSDDSPPSAAVWSHGPISGEYQGSSSSRGVFEDSGFSAREGIRVWTGDAADRPCDTHDSCGFCWYAIRHYPTTCGTCNGTSCGTATTAIAGCPVRRVLTCQGGWAADDLSGESWRSVYEKPSIPCPRWKHRQCAECLANKAA